MRYATDEAVQLELESEGLSMSVRILAVDDDQFVLLALMALRKRLGYKIETASSSREALEKLRKDDPFQVVISDRDMPGMDGIEFLRRSREKSPEMIRVMLSGGEMDEAIDEALREELLFKFIPKPCLPHQLAIHIEAAVEEYRRQTAEVC